MTTSEDPFVVVGHRDTERMSYPVASTVAAAAVAVLRHPTELGHGRDGVRAGDAQAVPGCLTNLSEVGRS